VDLSHLENLLTDWLPFVLLVETILLSALVTRVAIRRSEARAARRADTSGGLS